VDIQYLKNLLNAYRAETVDCLEFWVRFGIDKEFGGYLTCLDRQGEVFGYDKSVWFQGRGLYIFSKYYNDFDRSEKWLDAAKLGYGFLLNHCFDSDGRMFFIVARDGRPVQKRRYYFSETFAAVGCAEYYKATGDIHALDTAREVFDSIIYLYQNPQELPPKYNPDVVKTKSLAVPMILTTTAQTLREADPKNADKYRVYIDLFIKEITEDFLKPDRKALFETVGTDGAYIDSPAGRTVNPGHSIEASWFLMREGMIHNDKFLIEKALDILNWSFDIGWDKEYGGLLYFVDIDGKPSEKLEWDMKLWWPHSEALIAFLMAYTATKDEKYFQKFMLIHDYVFSHFRDREYGEWFGYLHSDGTVANTLKGNLFKGPFHIPRALMLCFTMLKELSENG
jgi:N-acylglucosamine 2-epimerase